MNIKHIFFLLAMVVMVPSCKKYLDAKPDKKLVIPSSVGDLQALLDQNEIMNFNSPSLGEMSADDYWLTDSDLESLPPQDNAVYTWGNNIYTNYFPNDWSNAYNPVYFSNIAIETIGHLERTEQNKVRWDNVKGSALLFRSKAFLEAAWIWCKAYDERTDLTDDGLPLRLSSDFNEKSIRSNLRETYTRIITDLKEASLLLPETPEHVMRPSKTAAFGYLAKTYLSMRVYDSCYKYANLALQLKHELIDYNTVSNSSDYPFDLFGAEVIMHSSMGFSHSNLQDYYARVDTILYNSYEENDLRKNLFYQPYGDGSFYFNGSYSAYTMFNGTATNENFLMRAECAARLGNKNGAMDDLNTLLKSRYKTGSFISFIAPDAASALGLVLQERRKELVLRGLRWMDLKRLNKESANIMLVRKVQGNTITLAPNANHYALPIPPDIIALSGMEQNPF